MNSIQRRVITSCLALCVSAFGKEPPDGLAPTYPDIAYGADAKQKLDVWLAVSDHPAPVLVYIHGGGWTSGDKSQLKLDPAQFLDKGISYISINYRLSKQSPLPVPVHDAARAIQFIRHSAKEWNLDDRRIALFGGSAGGCSSLWLAFHDDLADPNSPDPVARESTRVCAAATQNGQTSIDPMFLMEHIGAKAAESPMICDAVGEKSLDDALKNYAKHKLMYQEFSPINHVDKSDPPVYLSCGIEDGGIHDRKLGILLKERSDAVGHELHLSGTKDAMYKDEVDFLLKVLLRDGSVRMK
ncbi:MAG: alpha/beta hydrolase [Candidatus Sumerlaeota bacterium]|nr:alpha/beta hydrolase [Candidatus Sumerlaeota bacterium]